MFNDTAYALRSVLCHCVPTGTPSKVDELKDTSTKDVANLDGIPESRDEGTTVCTTENALWPDQPSSKSLSGIAPPGMKPIKTLLQKKTRRRIKK